MASTWLITGASSGVGQALALEALRAGYNVIGTTRSTVAAQATMPSEFESKGGRWIELDPGKTSEESVSQLAAREHVDVLVNSAGYALLGSVEDTSDAEIRDQMEVNHYGPLKLVRAFLPQMRERGSGEMVLISSGAGLMSLPSRSAYAASKFAIEAAHEALMQEVALFGIKVLIVELGAFRTPFANRLVVAQRFTQAYEGGIVDQILRRTKSMATSGDFAKGDPSKAAKVIVAAVRDGHNYLRLPLGTDSLKNTSAKIQWLQKDLERTEELARTTDVDR